MNTRAILPAGPLAWAVLWLVGSSLYLTVLYEPFTPDSYVYVAAARQALDTGCFCVPFAPSTALSLPVPLSEWPPGFPALVGIVASAGLDVWVGARCVAVASTFLAILIGALWLSRRPGGWAGLALAAACSMTAVVTVTAWSEGPFVLALGVAVASLAWWCETRGHAWPAALLLCGSLALALLIRHAGWFVLPAFAWQIRRRLSAVAWTAAGAIALACVPAALWLFRYGPRGMDAAAPLEFWRMVRSTGQAAAALGKLVVVPWMNPAPWLAVFGVLVICSLGVLQWRTRESQSTLSQSLWLSGWSLLVGTWLVGLVNPASFFVTDRLLWPAWIMLALALGTSLRPVHAQLFRVTLALLLLSQTAGVIRVPHLEPRPARPKQGFQEAPQLLTNQVVVSNEVWRAWDLWGVGGYHLPRSHQGRGVLHPDTLARWAARRQVQYLVWFDQSLPEPESVRRYGPVAEAGYGGPPLVLELVETDSICHTYRIRSAGTH